jgi:prepilin-type N-terminal cleavage/methylation domain-containing protein
MSDKNGFSLVEVMISLVVMLIIFLGLIQGAMVTIDSNMANSLREEAVDVAYMQMNTARSTPFASLNVGTTTTPVVRNFRNTSVSFSTAQSVATIDGNNKSVNVSVTWNWKNQPYTFATSTYVRNPS